MIPKIIHYCWFGRNPLPDDAKKCIASWRKFLPDYEIKEWNEDNFDVNSIPYTRDAYAAKKYAFVSDYARFWVLYKYGGLYFDTDVEVIKPLDDIVERGGYMGIEVEGKNGEMPKVAPGLGLAVEKNHPLYAKIIQYYKSLRFLDDDGNPIFTTVVTYNTKVLVDNGLQPSNDLQQVAGIWIYPIDFFNPYNSITGELNITDNTRSIHWYSATWAVKRRHPLVDKLVKWMHRVLGRDSLAWTRRFRK